jgi:hypothetical protein
VNTEQLSWAGPAATAAAAAIPASLLGLLQLQMMLRVVLQEAHQIPCYLLLVMLLNWSSCKPQRG